MHQTLSCLARISKYIELDVIIVDNGSKPGVLDFVKSKFREFNYIESKINLGFSKANNLGVERALADNILLLNPDTLISEEIIVSAITLLNAEDSTGAVAVRMIDGTGAYLPESARRFPSLKSSFLKMLGLINLSGYYMLPGKNDCIQVMSGACMFFKKSIFKKIGRLDERYFMYGEDIDISFQLYKNGYNIKFIDNLDVVHFKGRSSVKSNWNYQTAFYNAMKLYWQKNFNWGQQPFFNFTLNIALWMLKILSSFRHGIKQIILPIFDFLGILSSSILFTYFWSTTVKQNVGFLPNSYYVIILPLFTIGILFSMLFAKFYMNEIDLSRLVRASFINLILLLGIYFLLPADYKYSRAVIIYLWVISFFVPLIIRWLYSRMTNSPLLFYDEQLLVSKLYPNSSKETQVKELLKRFSEYKLVSDSKKPEVIIIDESQISNTDLINMIRQFGKAYSIWIYSEDGEYILQSHSKDASGYIIAAEENYNIYEWTNIIRKSLLNMFLTLIALPLAIFSRHRLSRVARSCIKVLFNGYYWVHVHEKAIFRLSNDLAEEYKRKYSLTRDVNYFFKYMFIS